MAFIDHRGGGNSNICFHCKRACGGCRWSEIDPSTGKPRFEPVPGWTAEKTVLNLGVSHDRRILTESYYITACPLFDRG